MLREGHPFLPAQLMLMTLFGRAKPTDWIEFRAIWNSKHSKPPPSSYKGKRTLVQACEVSEIERSFDLAMADWVAKVNRDGYDIYFGVCPRRTMKRTADGYFMAGSKEDVADAVAMWIDLDAEDWEARLKHDDPPAHLIVASGHGCHIYFLYEEVVPGLQVEKDNKRVAERWNGDSTHDSARILRLPGTRNWKDQDKTTMCELVRIEDEHVPYYKSSSDIVGKESERADEGKGKPGDIMSLRYELHTTIIDGYERAQKPYRNDDAEIDRSDIDYRVIKALFYNGWSEPQIVAIFKDPRYKISGKYFDEGYNGDQYLDRTIKKARLHYENEMSRSPDVGDVLVFETAHDVANAPPLRFSVDHVLPFGGMLLISGPAKAGKSLIVSDLLLLLSGAPGMFLEHFNVLLPGRVVYCQAEITKGSLAFRLNTIGRSRNIEWVDLPLNFSNRSLDLSKFNHIDALSRGLKKVKADYLVIDPLARFHTGNENRQADMANVLAGVERASREANLSGTIIIHHHGKPVEGAEREGVQRVRGASVIGDWGNAHILLRKRFSETTGRKYLTIEFELRDAEEPAPFDVVLDKETLRFQRYSEHDERSDIVQEVIAKETDKDKAILEIQKKAGCSKAEAARLHAEEQNKIKADKESKEKGKPATAPKPVPASVPVEEEHWEGDDDE